MENIFKFLYRIAAIVIFITLVSCGAVMKKLSGIPNLNVYSSQEIENNISEFTQSENITDVRMRDGLSSDKIKRLVYLSIPNTTYLYNLENKLLCFNGDVDCSIDEIEAIRTENINEQYTVCGDFVEDADFWQQATTNLDDVLNLTTYNSSDHNIGMDHKVIVFMNKDLAGEELQSNWQYIYEGFHTDANNVQFIRIWTDLCESQGLQKGAKAKFKMRKTDGPSREYELTLKDLPYVKK